MGNTVRFRRLHPHQRNKPDLLAGLTHSPRVLTPAAGFHCPGAFHRPSEFSLAGRIGCARPNLDPGVGGSVWGLAGPTPGIGAAAGRAVPIVMLPGTGAEGTLAGAGTGGAGFWDPAGFCLSSSRERSSFPRIARTSLNAFLGWLIRVAPQSSSPISGALGPTLGAHAPPLQTSPQAMPVVRVGQPIRQESWAFGPARLGQSPPPPPLIT